MKIPLKNTPVPKFPYGTGSAETPEEFLQALKSIRGWMLTECDWTQASDSPLDDATKLEWRVWRQAMRDISQGLNVDNIQEWIEIPNPPIKGQPYVWQFWEYDAFHGIMEVVTDMTEQSKAVITLQEQTTEHTRLHETGEQHVH
jgi:hypothetical protein